MSNKPPETYVDRASREWTAFRRLFAKQKLFAAILAIGAAGFFMWKLGLGPFKSEVTQRTAAASNSVSTASRKPDNSGSSSTVGPVKDDNSNPLPILREGSLNPAKEGWQVFESGTNRIRGFARRSDGNSYDAWEVQSDEQHYYWKRLDQNQKQEVWKNGWRLSADVKFGSGMASVGLCPSNYQSFCISFFHNDGGKPNIGLATKVSGGFLWHGTVEIPNPNEFQAVELVFDPKSQKADLYVNGHMRMSGYGGYQDFTYEDRGVLFGCSSRRSQEGIALFRKVSFKSEKQ